MNLFTSLNGHCPTVSQETAAIYTIVRRNLQPENWQELLPEARTQIISEADRLLRSHLLSPNQKQQLLSLVESERSDSRLSGEVCCG